LDGKEVKDLVKAEIKRKYANLEVVHGQEKFKVFKKQLENLSNSALVPGGDGPWARNIAATAFQHVRNGDAAACTRAIMGLQASSIFLQDSDDEKW
jgi:aspartokinase-like uncharacterized kinase